MDKITKIQRIQIDELFGEKNIDWEIKEEHRVSVLVGKNGAGKSTILRIIQLFLKGEYKKLEKIDFNRIKITFANDNYEYNNLPRKCINQFRNKLVHGFIDSNMNKESSNEIAELLLKKLGDKVLDNIIEGTIGEKLAIPSKFYNVVRLSAIDMNAAAVSLVKNLDGEFINTLSTATINIYTKLIEAQYDLTKLQNSINSFLAASNKTCILGNSDIQVLSFKQELLNLEDLSAGEGQLIYILLNVALASITDDLILMDEPEISLHLEWQERLLKEIIDLNPTSQVIVVTHSPAVIMNGWRDSYYNFKDITVNGQLSK